MSGKKLNFEALLTLLAVALFVVLYVLWELSMAAIQ